MAAMMEFASPARPRGMKNVSATMQGVKKDANANMQVNLHKLLGMTNERDAKSNTETGKSPMSQIVAGHGSCANT